LVFLASGPGFATVEASISRISRPCAAVGVLAPKQLTDQHPGESHMEFA
jgi:hypothetical protein